MISFILKPHDYERKGAVNKDEHFYYVGEYGGKEICMTYTGHSNLMSAVLGAI